MLRNNKQELMPSPAVIKRRASISWWYFMCESWSYFISVFCFIFTSHWLPNRWLSKSTLRRC